jgi:anti-sigma regulatory factor (Ser/Thr protein kinase)
MGLPNMKRYSDSLDLESVVGEGTTVTMVINIPG